MRQSKKQIFLQLNHFGYLKKNIMKKLILSILFLASVVSACRKSDNPKLPDLEAVPQPQLTISSTSNKTISATLTSTADADAFKGVFNVGLYFPDGIKPQQMEVVVVKNDDRSKVISLGTVTSYPSPITITGTQLRTLFGNTPIVVGDKFDFGVNITTTSGKVYPAFLPVGVSGNTYDSGVLTLPGATPSISFAALAKYVPSDYGVIGAATNYIVVIDQWQDYSPGDVIPVTVMPNNQLSFKYGAANAKPIIIKVDPETNITSVTKQIYGDYPPDLNFSCASVTSAFNIVVPKEVSVSVVLNHTNPAGNYGNYRIKLKKQ
jgi:hypothetical protein